MPTSRGQKVIKLRFELTSVCLQIHLLLTCQQVAEGPRLRGYDLLTSPDKGRPVRAGLGFRALAVKVPPHCALVTCGFRPTVTFLPNPGICIIVFKTHARESVTGALVPGGDSRKLHRKKTLDRNHWALPCQNNWGTWRTSSGLGSQKLGGQSEGAGPAGIMRGRELAVRSTHYAPGILVHLLLNLFSFSCRYDESFPGVQTGLGRNHTRKQGLHTRPILVFRAGLGAQSERYGPGVWLGSPQQKPSWKGRVIWSSLAQEGQCGLGRDFAEEKWGRKL